MSSLPSEGRGDLAALSIAELHHAYAERTLGPVEVTEHVLRRIRDLDGTLRTYLTVTDTSALADARRAEERYRRGSPLSALDGVPIGLKDNFDTAGVRTTANSQLYAERVPTTDATAVRRLRQVGAVLIGKHSMYEFALGRVASDAAFAPSRNPWDLQRIPGGSSSGSVAAVSAGLCYGALGSDTAGSIRWPASFCGVVGLKPTHGLVSRAGVVPLSPTLDHVGPITRTAYDTALMLACVAGYDPLDPASVPGATEDYRAALRSRLDGVRIGAPLAYVGATGELDPDVGTSYDSALRSFEQLGASVKPIALPPIAHDSESVSMVIYLKEAFDVHAETLQHTPERFGADFRERLTRGSTITDAEYALARHARDTIRAALLNLDVDILVTPTTLRPAWPEADDAAMPRRMRIYFTHLFSLSGQPAISVPCGLSTNGLPIGIQIVGQPLGDGLVLAAAHAYEQTDRPNFRPPIP